MMRILFALALSLLLAAPLVAQPAPAGQPGSQVVDRVVAVVGDTVLLLSDVQTALREMEAAGQTLPADEAGRNALIREILDARVNELILIEAAKDAKIEVQEDDVSTQVDEDLRNIIRQRFGSEQAFETALAAEGMTRAQYRLMLMDQYRNRQLLEQFLGQRMAGRALPLVSEDQLRRAFEERRGTLASRTRPATVSLQQVVVKPQPSDSARAKAIATAQQVITELRAGGDFEVLAKRFSDDPGSKEHGGDLGWFKPGRMVKEFENVAFALRPGDVSGIVETEFGLHIIKVERARGAERKARHILIRPEVTPADVERARQRADSVATAIRGGAGVLSLARQYKTPSAEMEVARIPIDQLPPSYGAALQTATAGQVVGPLELVDPRGASSWAVVKVNDRHEAGAYTLEDVREQLLSQVQQQMMTDALVADLRKEIFVRVMM